MTQNDQKNDHTVLDYRTLDYDFRQHVSHQLSEKVGASSRAQGEEFFFSHVRLQKGYHLVLPQSFIADDTK